MAPKRKSLRAVPTAKTKLNHSPKLTKGKLLLPSVEEGCLLTLRKHK
jgi:hypothetical protein